jgi:hypothetical protein
VLIVNPVTDAVEIGFVMPETVKFNVPDPATVNKFDRVNNWVEEL